MNVLKKYWVKGIFAIFIICICITSALAASGTVSFNSINFCVNGKSYLEKGQELVLENGTTIPSTITYTDENGGTTTYIPIRELAEIFHMPLHWNKKDSTATLSVDGLLRLYTMPLHNIGSSVDIFKEVETEDVNGGQTLLSQRLYKTSDAVEGNLRLEERYGNLISITITNHSDLPVEFSIGKDYVDRNAIATLNSQVPAGETVTRTIQIADTNWDKANSLYYFIGYKSGLSYPVDITISAVQYNSKSL